MFAGCSSVSTEDVMEWIPKDTVLPDVKESMTEEQQSVSEERIYPVAQDVLVIGNSITLGFGSHGMASSAVDTDYYYLLHEYLLKKNSNLKMMRIAGYGWEGSVTSEERLLFLEKSVLPELSEECDLIIIQLGDNVNTAEKLETFSVDAENILEWFREKRPNARILWVFGRYNLNNGLIIQAACEKYDVEYVDISITSKDDRYKAKLNDEYEKPDGSVGIITDAGVASHPSDEGMAVISEIIIKQLGYEKE